MSTPNTNFSPDRYREEGFTGPVRVLSPEQARAGYRHYFAAIGQSARSPGPTDVRPGGFNLQHRWAYDLCAHERTLDYVEQILGPDIVLWAMAFWYKEPHNDKYIPWHQDAVYWPMQPRINLTAWVALGPTSRQNGCLRLIPGSHRKWLDDDYRPLDEKSAFAEGLDREQVDESKAIDLEMAPGECVFFTEATLHSSHANTSDQPRVAYSLRFTTPAVKFDIDGLKQKGIDYLVRTMLVRGTDRFHFNDALIAAPPR